MKRRRFFSTCASFVAGCMLGVGVKAKAAGMVCGLDMADGPGDAVEWKVNPEWINAPFIIMFGNPAPMTMGGRYNDELANNPIPQYIRA